MLERIRDSLKALCGLPLGRALPHNECSSGGRTQPVGLEEWLKRVGICFALLYVNGYAAFRAYTATFGLTPKDFGADEKDYLMHGISNLILDSRSLTHPSVHYWPYYLLVLLTWSLLAFGFFMAFTRGGLAKGGSVIRYSGALAVTIIFLSLVAAQHGVMKARLAIRQFTSLPYVMVAYESPENQDSLALVWGQMLVRTETILCLANVQSQMIGTNWLETPHDTRLLLLASDKVLRVALEPPPALIRELERNEGKTR